MKKGNTTQTYSTSVTRTTVKVDYRVTTDAEGVVSAVFGTAKKADAVVGYVNYERQTDRAHISFEPYSGLNLRERKALACAALADVAKITGEE